MIKNPIYFQCLCPLQLHVGYNAVNAAGYLDELNSRRRNCPRMPSVDPAHRTPYVCVGYTPLRSTMQRAQREECPRCHLHPLETALEHSTNSFFRSHESVETLLAVHWSMVGRTGVVLCRAEGYRCTCVPDTADEGDPFDSQHLMTLPDNGWDALYGVSKPRSELMCWFPKATHLVKCPQRFRTLKKIDSRHMFPNAWLCETRQAAENAQQYFCPSWGATRSDQMHGLANFSVWHAVNLLRFCIHD